VLALALQARVPQGWASQQLQGALPQAQQLVAQTPAQAVLGPAQGPLGQPQEVQQGPRALLQVLLPQQQQGQAQPPLLHQQLGPLLVPPLLLAALLLLGLAPQARVLLLLGRVGPLAQ
jgi:hypothetical protein